MKHRNTTILPLTAIVTALLLSACNDSNNSPPAAVAYIPPAPPAAEDGPTFTNVGVHDPSVIKVGDTYYVFGSHLAVAKSTDLMNWQLVADGVNGSNPLFDNVLAELQETFDWAETDTLWAADVIQLADGKFYMYYNACRGDSPRSALGVAVADHIEGPYVNKQILLKSGMWGEPSEDGTIYDAQVHPNVVDPHTFFDKNGKLWMIYGSYSGGLFILEMDPATGLTLPGQGYGTHLMGGNHSRIEGAYVLYSPDTDYYYLFTSFGGLDANGAYNMRVARSTQPDGPYEDALGNDMATVKSDSALPLFDDVSIAPYAQKIMGNHLFVRGADEPGTGGGSGYVSPGHNSAYYDADSGQYFLLFHTRFPGLGEQHQLRVHEFFINQDGWPVIAPHRYAPLSTASTELSATIAESEVAGQYKFINHGKDISATTKNSQLITLGNDGTVSGSVIGNWHYSNGQYITLDLGSDGLYQGVLSHQWHETPAQFVITFTAQSVQGVSVWGSKVPE
ncbi:glycoside hydrolase family 43 protein [Chromatiaceae bacterium AAb-1]|nr:glycoside hydrolase family 43 protein [Chromatiaceae bacterium AAb-1]